MFTLKASRSVGVWRWMARLGIRRTDFFKSTVRGGAGVWNGYIVVRVRKMIRLLFIMISSKLGVDA